MKIVYWILGILLVLVLIWLFVPIYGGTGFRMLFPDRKAMKAKEAAVKKV